VLISGGDPSFLDDQKWQSNPMGEEDEPDLEDDITASGGDPTFLDDRTWGADDDEFGSDLEDDITMSGGDPSFLDDSEWDEKARKA
jgi:L-lysine 2,3-aminomutase